MATEREQRYSQLSVHALENTINTLSECIQEIEELEKKLRKLEETVKYNEITIIKIKREIDSSYNTRTRERQNKEKESNKK